MRVTEKDLTKVVERLNELTESPMAYFGEGRKTNIDHFCLYYAYGGVQLQRVCNESGGVSTYLHSGFTTKKDLYNLIHAFIDGYKLAKGI